MPGLTDTTGRLNKRSRVGPGLAAALAAGTGAACGAALMYWFDPDRGRSRRTRAESHSQAIVRRGVGRAASQAGRQARYLEGKLKGTASRLTGHGRYHPESDVDLREHLRQVIRSLPLASSDITVDVCAGRVSLRGQVQTSQDQQLISAAVAQVPGVVAVEDYLHPPGTDAPNKTAVLHLSASSEGHTS